jgi:hypothetical protein
MEHEQMPDIYSGIITVKPQNNLSLQNFCLQHIPAYSIERYRPLAVRVYFGRELIVTVFAEDLSLNSNKDHVPVKKFKIEHLILTDLLLFLNEFNFTLTTGSEYIGDMRVINR